jgi:polyphenol oxidase
MTSILGTMAICKKASIQMNRDPFIIPEWKVPENIKAIQTIRINGFSSKGFSSFNLSESCGDNLNDVSKNIYKLKSYLPVSPKWLNQTHSSKVIRLPNQLSDADASYSRSKKTICTILTADCLPILLTDTLGSFVASIHAGWRGMAFGVIENTFKKIGISSKAIVWLGPCISKKNFEVGLDVYDIYIKRDPRTAICFDYKGNGKFNFDLILAAKIKLKNLGVLNVSSINKCTFDDSDNFFSYRRDGNTGRMASLVWIDH